MTKPDKKTLLAALKEHFGFSSFRPLQYEIVEAAMGGNDVLAVLPTGAGKSLCYQLPAVVLPGLAVVISPLIALMKDQVDGLKENGIEAAYLNSSQDENEAKETWRALYRGDVQVLYLSPERLLMEGMLDTLEKLNLSFVAVDEAHCISSWGHDFRPEYRALKNVRARFPELPIVALTATATDRVRHDIVTMLGLRKPHTFVASFNRPNLSYRVIPRDAPVKQILEIIAGHPEGSIIVYCLSRAKTESVADELVKRKIKAEAYHAGLTTAERTKRQERFIRDKTRVMVATVAFGMGIDKPDVRCVIHHDLPKNVEGYYQETGRAGRDGLPSECVLLFDAGDAAKLRAFTDELTDEREREVAARHINQIVDFAETGECRRVALLRYFGETYSNERGEPLTSCGACDNCLTPRERVNATEIAQKLISCVLRIKNQSGFGVGVVHLADVLTGASTEKIRQWKHDRLTTYGIGKNLTKKAWIYYAKELVSAGLLQINTERFNTVEVTTRGLATLKEREGIELRAPLVTSGLSEAKRSEQRKRLGGVEYDRDIFERLRQWRAGLAQKRGLPAYMILNDSTLQAISVHKPTSIVELSTISGFGEKKLEQYGESLLEIVREHVA